MQPGHDGTHNSPAGTHGRDDVTDPVAEVQEGSFRLGSGLPLDGHVCLRLASKVLGPDDLACYDEANGEHGERPLPRLGDLELLSVCPLSASRFSHRVNRPRETRPKRGRP